MSRRRPSPPEPLHPLFRPLFRRLLRRPRLARVAVAAVVGALAVPSLARAARPPAAPPDPAHELVARIQKFYDGTRDLHGRFEQVIEATGRKKSASGDVWLKKPGRMRWDYVKPEKKLMVADGATLWVYEPEDQQAFRQSLTGSTLPSSVSFLTGAGRLADEFEPSIDTQAKLGAPGDVVLKLVPKQATAQYRYVEFVVDGKTAMVKETMVYDQQGGTNHMTFRDVVLNRGVDDAKFKFTPPAGTRVLRP